MIERTFDSRTLAKMNFVWIAFARGQRTAIRIPFACALPSKSSNVRATAERRLAN
jgi:hypothetical protein